ncbi:hypothetical protein [Thalassospira mesophila]|uniref:hypothetical protein n=1 Tax=Thalassospira mesophila TaxID=1293891 RepID=UPI000A1DA955|nr:hypothetical protein [Thalassospira mesophila]
MRPAPSSAAAQTPLNNGKAARNAPAPENTTASTVHENTGNSANDENDENRIIPDPDELAIRFLELWRAQVAATASGGDAASAIGRLYAGLGADTSRLAEGFEAWGRLIGQLATGQSPAQNPFVPGGSDMGAAAGMNAMFEPITAMMNFKPPFTTGKDAGRDTDKSAGSTNKPRDATAVTPPADGAPTGPKTAVPSDQNTKTATSGGGAKTAPLANDGEENGRERPKKAASERTPGGPKAAGDASRRRDDELAELARRLAALSETIDALEAGADDSGGKPASGDVPPQQ